MSLYSIKNNRVKKIHSAKVEKEKSIQQLFERNLSEILDIKFLASEYSTSFGGRIDSLGIDNSGSPAIIEYKRSQNQNVLNQALSYLLWLLDHKSEFESLVKEAKVENPIDWGSPRVICIAEAYNKFDLDAAELFPCRIDLLKFQIYQSDILLVEREPRRGIRIPALKTSKKEKVEEKRGRELKGKYNISYHIKKMDKNTKKIFEIFNEKIITLDESIVREPKAKYIAYKLTKNFVDVIAYKAQLKMILNIPSGELDDPNNIARDLTKPKKIGHWGNGDYEVKIKEEKEVDPVFHLVEQSYIYNK